MKTKPVVFLSARVHPGESNASWAIKGVIEFLTGPSSEALALRRQLVFKIVPMLNPDGVVHGNYRCSLAGVDLNRNWMTPDRTKHPTIFYVKRLIKALAAERPLLLFCDFHGHSSQKDVVLYGCDEAECNLTSSGGKDDADSDDASDPDDDALDLSVPSAPSDKPPVPLTGDWAWMNARGRERIFAALCQRRAPQYYSYDRSTWTVTKAKVGASRVAMWRELKMIHAFTLEASFCGPSTGAMSGQHYNTSDFEDIGKMFCLALYDLVDKEQVAVYTALADVHHALNKNPTRRKREAQVCSKACYRLADTHTCTSEIVLLGGEQHSTVCV